MSKVDFSVENLQKCICKTCPVQADSECVKEKMLNISEMLESGEMADAEMVPGLYCASGKTSCPDLDMSKMCQCNECPIWEECDLVSGEPLGYYCRDGEAR